MRQFQMNKQSWRKRSMSAADITGDLPIYNPASAVGRRDTQISSSTSPMKYRLIHLIPLVVMVCFFILWCFSSPVDLETKDGRTTFVPRARNKKPPQTGEAVDLTVLALESPPDGFLSASDGPYASVSLLNQPNVSLLDSHDHSSSSADIHLQNASLSDSHLRNASLSDYHLQNASLSDSHLQNASLSASREPSVPFSDIHEPKELFIDLHEPNASFSASHDAKLLLPVSDEPRHSYAGKSNKDSQQASGEG